MEVGSLSVNFGLGVEDAIRRAIASHEPSSSASPSVPPPTASWLLSRHAVLSAEGFSSADAWAAIEATWADPDPSAGLEWLLLRLPRERLPAAFASQLSALKSASVVVRAKKKGTSDGAEKGGEKGDGESRAEETSGTEGPSLPDPAKRCLESSSVPAAPLVSSSSPYPAAASVPAASAAPKKDPSVAAWILQRLEASSSSSSSRSASPGASAPSSPSSPSSPTSSSASSLDDFDPYETPQAREARRAASRARRREERLPRASRVAKVVRELQDAMARAAAAKRAKNDKDKKAAGADVGRLRGALAALCLEDETVDGLVREFGAKEKEKEGDKGTGGEDGAGGEGKGDEAETSRRSQLGGQGKGLSCEGIGQAGEQSGLDLGLDRNLEEKRSLGSIAANSLDSVPPRSAVSSPRSPSSPALGGFSLFDDDSSQGPVPSLVLAAGTVPADPNAPPATLLEAARRGHRARMEAQELKGGSAGSGAKPPKGAKKKGSKAGGKATSAASAAAAPPASLQEMERAVAPPPPCPPADLLRRLWARATGGGGTVAFVQVPRGAGSGERGDRARGASSAEAGSSPPSDSTWRVVLKGSSGAGANARGLGTGGGKPAGKRAGPAKAAAPASAPGDLAMLSARVAAAFQKQRKGRKQDACSQSDGANVVAPLAVPPERSTMTVLSPSDGLGTAASAVPTAFVDAPEEEELADDDGASGASASRAGLVSGRDLVAVRALFEAFSPDEGAWLSLGTPERALWFRWTRQILDRTTAGEPNGATSGAADERAKGNGSDGARTAGREGAVGEGADGSSPEAQPPSPASPDGPPGLYAEHLARALAEAHRFGPRGPSAARLVGEDGSGALGAAGSGASASREAEMAMTKTSPPPQAPLSPSAASSSPSSDEDAWDASIDRIGDPIPSRGSTGAGKRGTRNEARPLGKPAGGKGGQAERAEKTAASAAARVAIPDAAASFALPPSPSAAPPRSRLDEQLLRSLELRRASPKGAAWLGYRASLPIWKVSSEIASDLASSNCLVICAETGSGKTTQVPQFILDDAILANKGSQTSIVVAQPRRVAATSVARRVAEERGGRVGEEVGHHVRLDRKAGRDTRLLFCTTGVLLRRLQADPDLSDVSHVIIDEVHERTIEGDFLLTLLRDLVAKRAARTIGAGGGEADARGCGRGSGYGVDIGRGNVQRLAPLKLVLMSATADAEALARYLAFASTHPAPTDAGAGVGALPGAPTSLSPASASPAATLPSTASSPAALRARSIAPVVRCSGRTFPVTSRFLEDAIEDSGWLPEGQSRMLRGDWDDRSAWESAAAGVAAKRGGGAKASIEALVQRHETHESLSDPEQYSSRTRRILSRLVEKELDPELIAALVEHLNATLPPDGSILVFLPGVGEIAALVQRLDEEQTDRGGGETRSMNGAEKEPEWGDEEEQEEEQEEGEEEQEREREQEDGDGDEGGGEDEGKKGVKGGETEAKQEQGVSAAAPSRARCSGRSPAASSIGSSPPLRLLAVPLHSRSPPHAQRRAFARAPRGYRKVVVATNVAETSITIDDVVAVVDSARLREMRHDPARGLDALELDLCSRASLEQRRGRAGRVRAGVCYTLLTRKTYANRPRRPVPEMRRAPLQGLVLAAKVLSPGPVAALLGRAPDPPTPAAIAAAVRDLCDIGALAEPDDRAAAGALDANAHRGTGDARRAGTKHGATMTTTTTANDAESLPQIAATPSAQGALGACEQLTHLGRRLAAFPTTARTAKLLVLGAELGAASAALAIAACLALRSPLPAQNRGGGGGGGGERGGAPLERTLQSMLGEARRLAGADAVAPPGAGGPGPPSSSSSSSSSSSALLSACLACLSGSLSLRSDPLAAAGALLLALETRRRGGKRAEVSLCRRYDMRLEDVEELTGVRNQLAGALVASGGVFEAALRRRTHREEAGTVGREAQGDAKKKRAQDPRSSDGRKGDALADDNGAVEATSEASSKLRSRSASSAALALASSLSAPPALSLRSPTALADSPLEPWNRHAASAPLLAGLLVAAAWPDVAGSQVAPPPAKGRRGGRSAPTTLPPPLVDASGPARPSPSSLCADFGRGKAGHGTGSWPETASGLPDPLGGAPGSALNATSPRHPSKPLISSGTSFGLQTPFLAYLSKLKTSSTYLASCSPASPGALLLFGSEPHIAWTNGTALVGRHVIAAPPARAALLKHLRKTLFDVVLQHDAENAGTGRKCDDIADGIVAVLEAEATAGAAGTRGGL